MDFSSQPDVRPNFTERLSRDTNRSPRRLIAAGMFTPLAMIGCVGAFYNVVEAVHVQVAVEEYGLSEQSQLANLRDQKLEDARDLAVLGLAATALASVALYVHRPEEK